MDPSFCLECVNFFPTPTNLQIRSGFDVARNFGTSQYYVSSLIVYNETNGDTVIFAATTDIFNNFVLLDMSDRSQIKIANFPLFCANLKYVVNNNLYADAANTISRADFNNLVLAVYTTISVSGGTSGLPDINVCPFYLQNNHWGNYHIIPTTLTLDGEFEYTNINPTKITATVTLVTINLISMAIDTTATPLQLAYQRSGQIIIVQKATDKSFVRLQTVPTPTLVGATLTIYAQPLISGSVSAGDTFNNTITFERYLMFDQAILPVGKFKPISITQVSGVTAMVFADTFLLYVIISDSSDAYSARYRTNDPNDLTYTEPLIIPFAYYVKLGGRVVNIDSWTVDSGGSSGQQDYLAIFLSSGEILVYKIIPNTNATTGLPSVDVIFSNTYRSGEIFTPNCSVRIKGDLVFLSAQGVESMSNLVSSTRVDTKSSISSNIAYPLSNDITRYRNNQGWAIVYFQLTNMLIINVPTSKTTAYQYVMNTSIANNYAWCRFTNINALCYGQTDQRLYFGNRQIYILFYDEDNQKIGYDLTTNPVNINQNTNQSTWDVTNWDQSVFGTDEIFGFGYRTTIGAEDGAYFVQAFTKLDVSLRKKINLIKPNIYNYSLVYDLQLGMGSDGVRGDYQPYNAGLFNPGVAFFTPQVYITPNITTSLDCSYDDGFVFGDNQVGIPNGWVNLPAFGFSFSLQFLVKVYLNDFEYTSSDLVFEISRNII